MAVIKPTKPTIEDCRVHTSCFQVDTLEDLASELEDLIRRKVDINNIKFQRYFSGPTNTGSSIVVWYNLDQKATDEEYRKKMHAYESKMAAYKENLKKAYEEEFGHKK